MIAWIALGISIFDLILWIVVAIGIRKVFLKLYPVFASMGFVGSQNLMYSTGYGKMGEPPELADADIEQ